MINLIVAFSKPTRVIGNDGHLPPWKVPGDLVRFKSLTEYQVVLMGRKTLESLPNGPLMNRINMVMTRAVTKTTTGLVKGTAVVYVPDFQTAVQYYRSHHHDKTLWIIGGAQVYREALASHQVDALYITEIEARHDGDCTFPELDHQFVFSSQENHPTHAFVRYVRSA